MVEVKQLVDNSGEFYPVTAAEAVIFSNGDTLEEKQSSNVTNIASKQDVLISGTNIKTINNTSLLGSGNITINADTSSCEQLANKVTSISSSSTDAQYPSAKCMYDIVGDIELALNIIINGTS